MGKGLALVSVLIPNDCESASCALLANPENRRKADVYAKNKILFSYTLFVSDDNITGYNDIRALCEKL